MESFQRSVVIVFIIILLITLAFVSVMLYNAKYNQTFPPVIPNCPDYWLDNSKGDNINCFNIKNLGAEACKRDMDFSTADYKGNPGLCKKKKWATDCQITWDGISNNDSIKCWTLLSIIIF